MKIKYLNSIPAQGGKNADLDLQDKLKDVNFELKKRNQYAKIKKHMIGLEHLRFRDFYQRQSYHREQFWAEYVSVTVTLAD